MVDMNVESYLVLINKEYTFVILQHEVITSEKPQKNKQFCTTL